MIDFDKFLSLTSFKCKLAIILNIYSPQYELMNENTQIKRRRRWTSPKTRRIKKMVML